MNLKECINNLTAANKNAKDFIEATNKKGADDALLNYVDYIKQSNYNSGLSLQFAYVLQFCSDPTLFEQYELKDIQLLYDSFINLNNYCLDIYIDAANFAEAVMDDKVIAKQIVDIGIRKLKTQLAELQELEKELNSKD